MRIGPWVLTAGLALLGAGIVSSASDAWKHDRKEQVMLDMTGANALDIGTLRIDKIVLGKQGNAVLHYTRQEWGQADEKARVSWKRNGGVLKLDGNLDYGIARNVLLRVPVRVQRLVGRDLTIEAEAVVPSLRIESIASSWQGDARTLDVRMMPSQNECVDENPDQSSTFEFKSGTVASLRIWIEKGSVNLDDLSRVEAIELHAGDDVRLNVHQIKDLDRIRILPFDGQPAVASGDDMQPGRNTDDPAQAPALAAACVAASVD